MNDIEAILILELGTSFTGEELKKAHRRLTKEYHPDKLSGESENKIKAAEEKIKSVTSAYQYLKNKYFPNSSYENRRVSIDKKYYHSKTNNYNHELILRLNKEIERYKSYFGFEELEENIAEEVKDTINAIGHKYNNEEIVNSAINKMHNAINQKFTNYLKHLLISKLEKYKSYPGFNNQLLNMIDYYVNIVIQRNFVIKDDFFAEVNKSAEILFSRYNEIINKIENLKNLIEENEQFFKINEINFLEKIFILEQSFNRGNDITKELNELEDQIKEILNDDNYTSKIIFNKIVSNYQKRLSILNNTLNYQGGIELSYIFASAMNIFSKIEKKEIDVQNGLEILSKITFNNLEEDKLLIDEANILMNKSGIYIKNPNLINNSLTDQSFFYLKREDNNYIMYTAGITIRKDIVTVKQIMTEYISLEEFLKKGEYIGKLFKTMFGKMLLIYRLDNICLTKGDNDFLITLNINDNLIREDLIFGEGYEDTDKLIESIKIQVLQKIVQYENRNNKKTK